MIRFFQNIRKNLAAENKVAGYLRYAIGEIVLVVVGILIALSINNWNEQRKTEDRIVEILSPTLNLPNHKSQINIQSTLDCPD